MTRPYAGVVETLVKSSTTPNGFSGWDFPA